MATPLGYYDLVEIFPQPGCSICHLVQQAVDHRIDSLLYEYVNDLDTHAAVRAGRGLCNEHAAQLSDHKGYIVGIAILYHASLDEVLKILDRTPAQPASRSGPLRRKGPGESTLADALESTGPCPACETLIEAEDRYLEVFADYLSDPRFVEKFRRSEGLCLPHFRSLLRYVHKRDDLQTLLDVQRPIWEGLRGELDIFIEKMDHNKRAPLGDERDSPWRAIRGLAGGHGLFKLRR